MSTLHSTPKQVVIPIPLSFATATDIEVKQIKSRTKGRLKSIGISIDGTTKLAADIWTGIMMAFGRQKATLKMIDGYLSAPQDGDNQGLIWYGNQLIDEETSFVVSIYNRSGETIIFDVVLVIESEF